MIEELEKWEEELIDSYKEWNEWILSLTKEEKEMAVELDNILYKNKDKDYSNLKTVRAIIEAGYRKV